MNTLLRIFAFMCGLLLLVPGLCTVLFGGAFTLNGASGGLALGLLMLIIGGLLAWAGWAVLRAAVRRD